MNHLLISREYPPASYAPGGIGTYALNIARLLAQAGETVHVIGERWRGASLPREVSCDGRLIVHRVAAADAGAGAAAARWLSEMDALTHSRCPAQWFSLQAAMLAEQLIEREGIDLIEGQEWEAPLYYLLLRRAIGLGPTRQPPCVVHLHSPTEFIVRFNGWDISRPEFLDMKRMEDYCIGAADALLCPSHLLARECEARHRLPSGSVQVIRLPLGRTPFLERDRGTWAHGTICYVGRLEPRKGVIEWVDAAVQVAAATPAVAFDFVGADLPSDPFDRGSSMQRFLRLRIPATLRSRFRFYGSVDRAQLLQRLGRARAAAVPSRWENFPNTCVEAMRTGLPVIATRRGGMAEMLEDNVSGWLVDDDVAAMVPGLATALQRCLAATPEKRRAMGIAAAAAIEQQCDNRRIVEQHLAFRARVAHTGSARAQKFARVPAVVGAAQAPRGRGIGIVAWIAAAAAAPPLLDSIRRQRRAPAVVVIAGPPDVNLQRQVYARNGRFVPVTTHDAGSAWSTAFSDARAVAAPVGWLFLDQHDRLQPDALERLEQAFVNTPALGIISCWTGFEAGTAHGRVPLNPALPHQWVFNDIARATAFRAAALPEPAPFGARPPAGAEVWSLTLSLLTDGWAGVTYPAMLATRACDDMALQGSELAAFQKRRAELLQWFAPAVADNAPALIDLYVPSPAASLTPPRASAARRALRLLRHPQYIVGALRRHWPTRLPIGVPRLKHKAMRQKGAL